MLGKRGEHADFAKLHLGGSLEQVVRASLRPVLVASREFRAIRKLLIAFDGGPSSAAGPRPSELRLDGAALTLLRSRLLHRPPEADGLIEMETPVAKEATFMREGVVFEILPQSRFRVDMDEGARVLAQLSSKARRTARPLPGDRVVLEMTHYDEERGRIVEVLR